MTKNHSQDSEDYLHKDRLVKILKALGYSHSVIQSIIKNAPLVQPTTKGGFLGPVIAKKGYPLPSIIQKSSNSTQGNNAYNYSKKRIGKYEVDEGVDSFEEFISGSLESLLGE